MVESIEKIQPIQGVLPIAQPLLEPTHFDLENSSIGVSAPKEVYVPSKPALSSPIHRTLETFVGKTEPTIDRWSRFKETDMEKKLKEVEDLHIKEAAKMRESYEASKDVSFWGILEDMGHSIMGAVSAFFGYSAISAGAPVVGGALLVSGMLSIGNLAFKHAGIWDWTADHIQDKQTRESFRNYVPSAVGITAAALSIYGSYAAWGYTAFTGMKQVAEIMKSTTNVGATLVAFTSGMTRSQLSQIRADLSSLEFNREISTMAFERYTDDLKEFHEKQTELHSKIGRIIEETDQTIQGIQQPV